MIRIATDAELTAHIAAHSEPAAMLKLNCGDVALKTGVFVTGDVVECDDCGHEVHVNDVFSLYRLRSRHVINPA